jgi:Tol biopolymer transport system component
MLGLTACGGRNSEAPSLPVAVPLSPEGVRHVLHSFSPDGKRIAYWAPAPDVVGRWQLWVANADLSSPVKLPVTSTANNPPFWSPDGRSLLAGSADYGVAQVVIVPASGGEVRRVTQGASLSFPIGWFRNGEGVNYYGSTPGTGVRSFVYSVTSGESRPLAPSEKRPTLGAAAPDGSHVAYCVIDGSKLTLWVADADGSHPRQLTTEGFENLMQYEEWSPDSRELLYVSRRTGHADLWIMPIDGGKPRQLTRDVRDDAAGAWSSDGKWIAFLSNRGRQTDVWIVPAAGGAEQRVTDTPAEEQGPLVWRPGTGTLTFRVLSQENGVWALDLAGGIERRLTPESQRVTRFHPSPDGTQILYVVQKGGNIQDLVVSPVAGGAAHALVEGGGTVERPQWSPDGKTIVFASDRGGSPDIWAVDTASRVLRQVTNWTGYEGWPVWSLDGSEIYFNADKDTNLGDIWRVPASGGDPTRVTTAGNFGGLSQTPGGAGLFVQTISDKAGQLTLSRLQPDGRVTAIWDKSSVGLDTMFDPAPAFGDSVVVDVEQPDGKTRSMILSVDGRGGRVILNPGETVTAWSADGQWILYQLQAGGATDVGLLRVADGTTRRLTTTPEAEVAALFTPDGKTVLFRRSKTVQRITAVDLSKMLVAK